MKPAVDFTLTREERRQFYKFIKSVKFSNDFVSNLTKNIIDNDNKIAGFKSHDCHVIMHQLLLLGIQPFLKKPTVTTIADHFFQITLYTNSKCVRLIKSSGGY